jgi:tRNA (guanine-N7-)-methyltransferase
MGRRALPKYDKSVDLAGFLFSVDDLPNPFETEQIFGRIAPLEIEVGTGKGLFLRSNAPARADHDFLGIEVSHKYAHYVATKVQKDELDNVRMVAGDALRVFRELIPDNYLEAVHVYFPDPWWKDRHRKRRVMNEPFALDVQRTLRPGGRLHFWTDVEEYYQSALALLAEVTTLEGPLEVEPREADHDMDYHTHFERRTRQDGRPVYRAEFAKPLA